MKCSQTFKYGIFILLIQFGQASLWADNFSLSDGNYAASMGAGAATGNEPVAIGQNPAAFQSLMRNQSSAYLEESADKEKGYSGLYGLQFNYHHPFGIDVMSESNFGTYCDFNHIGMAMYYRETSVADLYRERGIALNPRFHFPYSGFTFPFLNSRISGAIDLGWQINYWSTEVMEESSKWKINNGFGAVWHLLPQFSLGGFVQGVPIFFEDSERDFSQTIIYQWGVTASHPLKIWSNVDGQKINLNQIVQLDFRRTADLPQSILGSYSLGINRFLQFTVGLSTPPFQTSFGVKMGFGGFNCNQSLRYHRYLGNTVFSGLGYSHLI